MTEEQLSCIIEALNPIPKETDAKMKEMLIDFYNATLDNWTDEAIWEYKLDGVVDREIVKKLILFGCSTITYEICDRLEELNQND